MSRPILQPPAAEVAAARERLSAAGVPLVEMHTLVRQTRTTWLGREKAILVPVPAGRGWLLGELIWTYAIRPRDGGGERTEPVLTILSESAPEYSQHRGLARARSDRSNGGYLSLGGWATLNSWQEALAHIDDLVTGKTRK